MLRLKASATLSSSPAICNLTLLTQTEPSCSWNTCQRTSLHRLVLRHLSQVHSLSFKLRTVCMNAFLSSFSQKLNILLSVVITLSFTIGHVSSRIKRNKVAERQLWEGMVVSLVSPSIRRHHHSFAWASGETGSPRVASTVSPRRRLIDWLIGWLIDFVSNGQNQAEIIRPVLLEWPTIRIFPLQSQCYDKGSLEFKFNSIFNHY